MRPVAGVAALILALVAGTANAADPPAGLGAVLDELRKGGLVIYFRHAATDQTGATDEAADLEDCSTQRNLSAEGRLQSARIGRAFRALGIPIGTVTTSPFCRCKETAQLAFGRLTVSEDLFFAIGTDARDTRRFARSLRTMLSTVPRAGTNAVIVSHSANLREAAGIWPKPEGVAYVFRPGMEGTFEAIARVAPDGWMHAVKPGQPGKAARSP